MTDHIHNPGCICHETDRKPAYHEPGKGYLSLTADGLKNSDYYTFGREDEKHRSRHATRIGFAAGFVTCFVLFTFCLLWWMP